jgi:hypothetical protein
MEEGQDWQRNYSCFCLDTLDFGPHREYSGLEKGYEL